LITIHHHWRVIFQVASALIGLVLLFAIFAFPETAYTRNSSLGESKTDSSAGSGSSSDATSSSEKVEKNFALSDPKKDAEKATTSSHIPPKNTYLQTLKVFHGTFTSESLAKLVLRPLGLICLPPVLWVALVEAATIGFLVAMTSNVEVAFERTYRMCSQVFPLICMIMADS